MRNLSSPFRARHIIISCRASSRFSRAPTVVCQLPFPACLISTTHIFLLISPPPAPPPSGPAGRRGGRYASLHPLDPHPARLAGAQPNVGEALEPPPT